MELAHCSTLLVAAVHVTLVLGFFFCAVVLRRSPVPRHPGGVRGCPRGEKKHAGGTCKWIVKQTRWQKCLQEDGQIFFAALAVALDVGLRPSGSACGCRGHPGARGPAIVGRAGRRRRTVFSLA